MTRHRTQMVVHAHLSHVEPAPAVTLMVDDPRETRVRIVFGDWKHSVSMPIEAAEALQDALTEALALAKRDPMAVQS